jgi:Secretion system C-terminal sorting domain
MMYKKSIFMMLFVSLLYAGSLFAQPKLSAGFFSKKGWNDNDSLLFKKLGEKYDLTLFNARDFVDSTLFISDLEQFDFLFVSESVSSWPWEYGDGPGIRSIPVPMVMLEGWLTKPEVLGWTTAAADTGYGTLFQDSTQLGVANNILILDDTGHELSAGFNSGDEVTLVTDSHTWDILTFTVPEIEYIPIAVSSLDPEKTIVMGVEAGTTVWNKEGTVLGESDSTVTENRAALVGVFAGANDFITDDGYKLIDAAIKWVLPKKEYSVGFFSKKGWNDNDSLLYDRLSENYDLTLLNARDFVDSTLFMSDLEQFDFLFVSESVSSWPWEYGEGPGIRSIPRPMVMLEGWLTKPEVLGWTTAAADTGYGTLFQDSTQLGVANNILILDDTGHELSAGFSSGAEVTLVSNSHTWDILTFTVPEIQYIPIAVSSLDPEKTIVMGVDKGTTVWNKEGTVLGESDSTVTKNRSALVGVFAAANDYITEDGYKLINAAISWVMKDATAIIDKISNVPDAIKLSQNYPNPFNPQTTISISLKKSGQTTLKVYNALGQLVGTLIDKELSGGTYKVTLNAENFSSGVYYYTLESGDFIQTKKMMLVK